MSVQYTLIQNEDGESNIVVFVSGSAPQVAHESHPNFEAILDGAKAGDESIVPLFDVSKTVGEKFERLSERVTTQHGKLFLDGVEVNNTLTEQVLRFMDLDIEDWQPLVAFFENVQANPNPHSREQLYDWLAQRDFTITQDGLIVGYKGVTSDLQSIHSGKAIVDGETVTGRIPNKLGSIIEMPRNEVQWDPSIGCHSGLHVGTYDYANSFAQGALLEVHVNPRDVVSVPTDCDWAKVRCCRYTVVDTIDAPYTVPVISSYDFGIEEDYEYDDLPWGDYDI
jgi:hypothetical protein